MSTTVEEARTCEMRIMGAKGDTRVTWNARDTDEVAQAKKTFDDLRAKRFLAFNVTADGSKGTQMDNFEPDAQKVIMVPPMAGGAGITEDAINSAIIRDLVSSDLVEVIDYRPHREASNDEVMAGALEWANTIRTEYGQAALAELPKGTPGEGGSCAMANALRAITDSSAPIPHRPGRMPSDSSSDRPPGTITARFSRDGKVHSLTAPSIVGEFIRRFDGGEIVL